MDRSQSTQLKMSSTSDDAKTPGGRRHFHFLPNLQKPSERRETAVFPIDVIVPKGYSVNM